MSLTDDNQHHLLNLSQFMRNIILFAFFLCLKMSYAQQKHFTIEGKIAEALEGRIAYLSYQSIHGIQLDSTIIKNGVFYFKGLPVYGTVAHLEIKDSGILDADPDNQLDFMIEPSRIKIYADAKLIDAQIEGSPIYTDFQELKSLLKPFETRLLELNKRDEQLTTNANLNELGKLDTAYKQARQNKIDLISNYIMKNNDKFMSLVALMHNSTDLGEEQIRFLWDKLSISIKKTDLGMKFNAQIDHMTNVQIGEIAPAFKIKDINNNMISLDDFRGKYILIEFWASWCGPCRKENPCLIKAYEKFGNKNFTILGISLDEQKDKKSWIKAVEDDKITWLQASELSGFDSEVAQLYHVKGLPSNFLVNPEGVIVARDLRGESLMDKLHQLLK